MSLTLGKGLELPLDAVTRATGIVGQRGTGKTSSAVVVVEEAARAGARFAVIDPTGAWYGLRSSADGQGAGLDCVVMGGWNGDVPLDHEAGDVVARLVVEEGYNVVLDLEQMTKGKQVQFVAEFCETAYHLCRSALTVVVDEAHRFAPQRVADPGGYGARCLGAVTDVVTLGRRKGLGAVLISQRPAKINKDVFEQAEIMVVHRLMGPNDRKAIGGWLEEAGEGSTEALDRLPRLERGEAVVYAPTYDVGGVFRIRQKQTFDSSATPEIGGGEIVLPKGRAEIDMGELEAKLGAALEHAEENDPKALKRRVAELEAQLEDRAPATHEEHEKRVEAERELTGALRERDALAGSVAELEDRMREGVRLLGAAAVEWEERMIEGARELGAALLAMQERLNARAAVDRPRETPALREELERALPTPAEWEAAQRGTGPAIKVSVDESDGGTTFERVPQGERPEGPPIKAGAKRMLEALLDAPRPLTRSELATLAVVRKGGTMSDYLSALRTHGYIVENGTGIALSGPAARRAAEELAGGLPKPRTPAQIVEPHQRTLKAGARRMLEHLMRSHPDGFTRSELSRLADVSKGGTFSDYLSSLKTRGLAEEKGRRVYAGSTLYIWAES